MQCDSPYGSYLGEILRVLADHRQIMDESNTYCKIFEVAMMRVLCLCLSPARVEKPNETFGDPTSCHSLSLEDVIINTNI
jgi:hypothetical protein